MSITEHWRWAIAAASIFVPAIALGTVTIPFSFTSGTVIKAADMNSNFAALKTAVDALQTTSASQATTLTGQGSSLTTLQAQRPVVLAVVDSSTIQLSLGQAAAGSTTPLASDSFGDALYSSTAPTTVTGGTTVMLSIDFDVSSWGSASSVSVGVDACAVDASGAFRTSSLRIATWDSLVASRSGHTQATFSALSAGTYRFGLCAGVLGTADRPSIKNMSIVATVYPG